MEGRRDCALQRVAEDQAEPETGLKLCVSVRLRDIEGSLEILVFVFIGAVN